MTNNSPVLLHEYQVVLHNNIIIIGHIILVANIEASNSMLYGNQYSLNLYSVWQLKSTFISFSMDRWNFIVNSTVSIIRFSSMILNLMIVYASNTYSMIDKLKLMSNTYSGTSE